MAAQPILAIETSCDDTCAAVLGSSGEILSNVVSSQLDHAAFGGVVPEIASRRHLELIGPVIEQALAEAKTSLNEIGLVAATRGPGLTGALLVGFQAAKSVAAAHSLPFAPVDHIHGHVAASFVGSEAIDPPFLILIASGGHTLIGEVKDRRGFKVLGQTLDDAAGEAFDKGARLLGLGYPGGPALQKLAEGGDPKAFDFPTADGVVGLDLSFSGLKTSLLYKIRDLGPDETEAQAADLAASYQSAIVETLLIRVRRALKETGHTKLAIGGGVAANALLRERTTYLGVDISIPPFELCTDNAAMIASAARYVNPLDPPDYFGLDVYASGQLCIESDLTVGFGSDSVTVPVEVWQQQ